MFACVFCVRLWKYLSNADFPRSTNIRCLLVKTLLKIVVFSFYRQWFLFPTAKSIKIETAIENFTRQSCDFYFRDFVRCPNFWRFLFILVLSLLFLSISLFIVRQLFNKSPKGSDSSSTWKNVLRKTSAKFVCLFLTHRVIHYFLFASFEKMNWNLAYAKLGNQSHNVISTSSILDQTPSHLCVCDAHFNVHEQCIHIAVVVTFMFGDYICDRKLIMWKVENKLNFPDTETCLLPHEWTDEPRRESFQKPMTSLWAVCCIFIRSSSESQRTWGFSKAGVDFEAECSKWDTKLALILVLKGVINAGCFELVSLYWSSYS